jgi:hypothetical protein
MDFQYKDIILLICKYLHDKNKINYLSVSKSAHILKHETIFRKKVDLHQILQLSYFDQFTNVIVGERFDKLPKNTKLVTFSDYFNKSINGLNFPPNIIGIKFGRCFDSNIDDCIPSTIKYLTFGKNFDCPINKKLPDNIIHVVFGRYFNKPINGILPDNLKHLHLGRYFNQSIDNLPSSLITLFLGHWFNEPICKLPNGLQNLYIDSIYSFTIKYLPSSIINLYLRNTTHIGLKIPYGVKTLILKGLCDLNNMIPSSVTHLTLIRKNHNYSDEEIPQSLKYLYVNSNFDERCMPNHPNMKIKYVKDNIWY